MQHHSISQNITDYTAKQNAFGRLSFYQQSLYKHGILSMNLDLFVKIIQYLRSHHFKVTT